MTTVVDIDLETGNLTEFTATAGTPTATAGAALHGSYGLNVPLGTTNQRAYLNVAKSTSFRYRFYFDPNGATLGASDVFTMQGIYQNGGSFSTIAQMEFRMSGGNYNVRFRSFNDAGTTVLDDNVNVTDATHYAEVYCVQAVTDVSSDGSYEWFMDGVSQGSVASVDNYNRMFDQGFRFQVACENGDAGTSGNFFFDDMLANDTGVAIGAITTGWANITKVNGVASASIAKVNSVAVASISKINGVSV